MLSRCASWAWVRPASWRAWLVAWPMSLAVGSERAVRGIRRDGSAVHPLAHDEPLVGDLGCRARAATASRHDPWAVEPTIGYSV